jgi:hypothetical protein
MLVCVFLRIHLGSSVALQKEITLLRSKIVEMEGLMTEKGSQQNGSRGKKLHFIFFY